MAVEDGVTAFGAERAMDPPREGVLHGLAAALPSLPSAGGLEPERPRPAAPNVIVVNDD